MLAQVLGTTDKQVVQNLFDYLFRSINKYQYREAMPSKEEAKALWLRVQRSGYVLLNCKLYLYARHVAKAQGKRVRADSFGIAPDDLPVLNRVSLSCPTNLRVITLAEFVEAERVILTDPDVDLDAHMGRFISRKLIFLCRSYGLTPSGIKAEFIENALYALRKQYPFYHSELHMLNICKTAIHNCGQSLIDYWTRGKRNALRKEDDGTFSAVHVDVAVSGSEAALSTLDPKDDPYQHVLDAVKTSHALLRGRARAFVSLAQGVYDPGFSMFLGGNNSDFAELWSYDRYLAQARSYLKVTEEQQARLMKHLRANL